ncbi:MAG: M6 family metalloprotease domain-containing protein [Prevotella sp.]|nr:M6 family metalloprotease domain-containing protein [Prevotella sp.]
MTNLLRQHFMKCAMLLCALFTAITISAVPAKPGLKRIITLANGTQVEAMLVGDEYGHYWLANDGKAYVETTTTGLYTPANLSTLQTQANQKRNAANQLRNKRMAARKAKGASSFTGQKKGIIILVNYQDVAMNPANNQTLWNRVANEVNFQYGEFKGSMRDYFYDQSDGVFELDFDVVGPYTVSQNRSYYGGNNYQGDDKKPASMVSEACQQADADVNFADYDWDGDGEVDQVYVVYAGKGEADGGPSSSIWPHEWSLSSAGYYGDGSGALHLDGVKIDTYACGPELDGSSGRIAGIGTMCHEFSHCLGYPDFYDTDYSGGQGMGNWDLMDSGSYNGNSYQPSGYTGYERWVAGWKTPITLSADTQVSAMQPINQGGDFYIIYNKANQNEYYLLENRQKVGWDASLPGKGLLIIHVDYNESAWASNQPNDDPSHQRMTWIPADNEYQYTVYQGTKYYSFEGMTNDTYPYGSVNAFNKNTTPAAKFYNKNSDGSYYMDSSIENIKQNSNGTVAFNFWAKYGDSHEPPIETGSGTFKKVADVSELEDGSKVIIACGSKSVAAGELDKTYLTKVDVTIADDVITAENVLVFTLEGSDGSYKLKGNDGKYLYAKAAKTVAFADDSETWTLSSDDSGVILKYGDNGTMLYNANSPRFTTYTSKPNASMILANLYVEYEAPVVELQTPVISFSETTVTATMGQEFELPQLTVEPAGLAVTYSSSDNDVATVDEGTGEVTLIGVGTTTITATTTATDEYESASASYTLKVRAEQPEPGEGDRYELVEDAEQLNADDLYIIVGEDENGGFYAISTTQQTNNRTATPVTMCNDGTIEITEEVQVITLEENDGLWNLKVEDGYLYAASSSKNYLRTETVVDQKGNANASITITDGIAAVEFQGTNTHNSLRYNPNKGEPIFSCYLPTSDMTDVSLYRRMTNTTNPLKGDANGDGYITVTDVVITVTYMVSDAPPAGFVFENADMDEDKLITINDVMQIVNLLVGAN